MVKTGSSLIKGGFGAVLALVGFFWTGHASAVIGAIDSVPAATLLLPYFESDLDNPNGSQTSVRLTNTSATAILEHVTLWTDLAVPTLQFNVYLVGYDTVTIDLRLLFQGIVPQTASAGQDPADLISPKGQLSQDINFASCSGILPPPGLPPTSSGMLPPNTAWEPGTLAAIRAAHTGQASSLWSGQCGAVAHGDNIARGYITIDTVVFCTQQYPSDPNYSQALLSGPFLEDTLIGSYTRINRGQNTQTTGNLASVEDSFTDPQVKTSGRPTFYASFNGSTAVDQREALGTVWEARTLNGGFTSATNITVWRDPGVAVAPFACGGPLPAPFPLNTRQIVAFDEQEHPTTFNNSAAFPYATQNIDSSTITPYQFGFMHLNLSTSDTTPLQSYVTVEHIANGTLADDTPAHMLITQSQLACQIAGPMVCTQTFPVMFGSLIP